MSEKKVANEERASKNKTKINRKKLIGAGIGLAAVLLLFAYFGYAAGYDKIYPNTYIGNEKISGLTYDEAKEKIEIAAEKTQLPDEIDFTIEGNAFSVKVSEIALIPDAYETVSGSVGKKEEGFFSRAISFTKSIFGRRDLTVAFSYDDAKLSGAISKVSSAYEIPPVDTYYEVKGNTLTVTRGHSGKTINKDALKSDISKYIHNPKKPVALKLQTQEEKEFDFDSFYKEITADAKDAYYSRDKDGNVIVVPDKPRVKVDKAQLKKLIESGKNTVSIKVSATPARVTKKTLEDDLFSGVMGSWTSYFTASNRPRSANVALSAQRIDGTVLLPGESFSYDKTVGPRTTKNGFQIAGVYINNKVEQGVGGGVCQTSSTLYSAVLYANLEIVSRTSHSLPVSYMPPGQDATIAEGAIDFVFKNNTDRPVKISATISGGSVTCKIIGTPVAGQKVVVNNSTTAVYEPKIEIATDASVPKGYKKTSYGSKGSAVASSRTVYKNGKAVSTQRLTNSTYNSTPTVVTVNPDDKNTPPESLKEYSAAEVITPPETVEQEGSTPATPPPAEVTEDEIIDI